MASQVVLVSEDAPDQEVADPSRLLKEEQGPGPGAGPEVLDEDLLEQAEVCAPGPGPSLLAGT